MKIFVYGSLMRGEFNHYLLKNNKFLGAGRTKGEYYFYDLGGFPGIVESGKTAVLGEIYEADCSTIVKLDILESHPQFYRRSRIELEDGQEVQTYILDKGYARGVPLIINGDWKNKLYS